MSEILVAAFAIGVFLGIGGGVAMMVQPSSEYPVPVYGAGAILAVASLAMMFVFGTLR